MARVVFDRVSKRYDRGATVVRDLSLAVEDEELLVLVGPSGCGKSTALRMIAGLEDITTGSLTIDGACVNDTAPKDRDVAMVFQSYALYPHMTCFENMAFALQLRRVDKREIRRRVEAAATTLGIEHLLERRPRELSGGQRQRVAIGRAIVREPRVFFMDEPLSNLDAKLRGAMRAEIKRLQRELRRTTVYVTHDQTEAMTLGDRIAVMRAGDVLQHDTPSAIYARPSNTFVATFIGLPEMNLFDGEVQDGFIVAPDVRTPAPPGARNGAIAIGIRPEHLRLRDGGGYRGDEGHAVSVTGEVEVVETTGAETFVHVRSRAGELVCRVAGASAPRTGETVRLFARASDLHLFDRSSGERLA